MVNAETISILASPYDESLTGESRDTGYPHTDPNIKDGHSSGPAQGYCTLDTVHPDHATPLGF